MRPFVYDHPAQRVSSARARSSALRMKSAASGARRVLVVSTPGGRRFADEAARRLGPLAAEVFADAVMHVPIETARAARQRAAELNADCLVAIGGGSTIGLGKAIALESALPASRRALGRWPDQYRTKDDVQRRTRRDRRKRDG